MAGFHWNPAGAEFRPWIPAPNKPEQNRNVQPRVAVAVAAAEVAVDAVAVATPGASIPMFGVKTEFYLCRR